MIFKSTGCRTFGETKAIVSVDRHSATTIFSRRRALTPLQAMSTRMTNGAYRRMTGMSAKLNVRFRAAK